MAVNLDAVGSVSHGIGVTNLAYTGQTVGSGANRGLVFSISWLSDPGAITVNRWDDGGTNQNLSLIISVTATTGQVAALYGLPAPTSGNKTLQITWTNAVECGAGAIAFTNMHQGGGTQSFPSAMSQLANAAGPVITMSLPAGAGVMTATGGTGNALNSLGPTQLWIQTGAGAWEGGGSYTVVGDGRFSSTWGSAGFVAMVACAVAEPASSVAPWINPRDYGIGQLALQQRIRQRIF